jgi:hypothetical protein
MSSASENAPTISNVFTFIGFSLVASLDSIGFHRERLHAANMVPITYPWALSVFAQWSNNTRGGKKVWIGCWDVNSQKNRPSKTWLLSQRTYRHRTGPLLAHRMGHALS